MFLKALTYFEIDALENLESFYAPVILRMFTISFSAFFVLLLLPHEPWRFLFVVSFLNIFVKSKELQNDWAALEKERNILRRYRNATIEEIKKIDDVCAVCLSPMTKARVTPCQHLFHAGCLRQCLKTIDICPICKQQLTFIH